MNQNEISERFNIIFKEVMSLREAGQKEYAGDENGFGNFNRLANELNIPRENVLWVYAMKHKDGIASYLRGHKSQREDVRGRINDLITYLMLLRCMIDNNNNNNNYQSEIKLNQSF